VPNYIFFGKHILPELESFFLFYFSLFMGPPRNQGFGKSKYEIWENNDFFVSQWRKKQ
jgi:hypothetical protein